MTWSISTLKRQLFRRSTARRRRPSLLGRRIEPLEDRLAPAIVSLSGGVLTIDYTATGLTSEAVTVANNGTNITLSGDVTGPTSVPTSDVTQLVVEDSGGSTNQRVTLAGTAAFSLSGGLQATGVEQIVVANSITATGSSGITMNAPGRVGGPGVGITVSNSATITTAGGSVSLTGKGGDTVSFSSLNFGVYVQSGTITAGGSGTVTVNGTGGAAGSGSNNGVIVQLRGKITSAGGAVAVTGTGGGIGDSSAFNYGVIVWSDSSTITAVGSGTVTVNGTGGAAGGDFNDGVVVTGTTIISAGGAVAVTGTGGGTGSSNFNTGVSVSSHSTITAGGDVTVTGTGGGTGSSRGNIGVVVVNGGTITAGGSSTVMVNGTGGTAGGIGNLGVFVSGLFGTGAITSTGGDVAVTGQSGKPMSEAIVLSNGGTIASGGTASLTVVADSLNVVDSTSTIRAGTAGNATLALRPRTADTRISLGGADVLSGSPLTLGLTDAELDRVAAGTVVLGDATSGPITVSTAITRPSSTAVELRSGGAIVFDPGSLDTGGGNLLLAPGAGGVQPVSSGTDVTAGTVSFASDLSIAINGTTVDSNYTQLNVNGTVNLTGVDLVLSGTYVPVNAYPVKANEFTIVSATSVIGRFNGLDEGAEVMLNGVPLTIHYTATAVTLTSSAPEITAVSGTVEPITKGASASVTVSFTDVDLTDTHTVTFAWGDGLSDTVLNASSNGAGSVTRSHTYNSAGVYTVTVTVRDNHGGEAVGKFEYVVVYDPSAGFVTGAGWINSPAAAYSADPTLTGKAHFGFLSRYQNGNNVPTGDTEFQFKVADFSFKSTSYEWMVVSGAKARYRGVGTVNGVAGYGFELTAWDGQAPGGGVDRFRIKIWLGNQGNGVVYDNMMNAADGADPTTALGGGSIVIHKGAPQLALGGQQVGGAAAAAITSDEVSALLSTAIARWAATGLSAADVARLRATKVAVADLPDGYLGTAPIWGDIISIDVNAAGYGWFIDVTPWDDVEFADPMTGGAAGRMDLLTVVMHELGHVIGLDSNFNGDSSDLMAAYLGTGIRRLPTATEAADIPTADAEAEPIRLAPHRRSVGGAAVAWVWDGGPRRKSQFADWLADAAAEVS